MSYDAGAALQAAVYQALRADNTLAALVGDAVFDAMPVNPPTGTYVALGPEAASEAGDATGRAVRHDFVVSVLSGADDYGGFGPVKQAAAAAASALESPALTLGAADLHLAGLWFVSARARRTDGGGGRRVDMTFRALVDLGRR